MESEAKKLAQLLLESGDKSYIETFRVTRNEEQTNEVVVVLAVQTTRQNEELLKKFKENFETKAVAYPSGQLCPMCGGSGKI